MCLSALQSGLDVAPDGNPPEVADALATSAVASTRNREITNLSLYRTREYRILEKAMNKLEAVQTIRKAKEAEDLADAGRLMRLHQAEQEEQEKKSKKGMPFVPRPYVPAEDGFVFSTDEIVTFVNRNYRRHLAKKHEWNGATGPLKATA